MDVEKIKPYTKQTTKKEQVKLMFNNIAKTYDSLNHILSLGLDRTWRKKLCNIIQQDFTRVEHLLDLATGTGDLAIQLDTNNTNIQQITACDISTNMLDIAKTKNSTIHFIEGDAENIPFTEKTFDIVTIAFGVRNFESLQKGLQDIHRVLKDNGKMYILELSTPKSSLRRSMYSAYLSYILPYIGGIISKDKKAYTYLAQSMKHFPNNTDFTTIIEKQGFTECKISNLFLGICNIYEAKK